MKNILIFTLLFYSQLVFSTTIDKNITKENEPVYTCDEYEKITSQCISLDMGRISFNDCIDENENIENCDLNLTIAGIR